jgi:metal-responsive CopG/Arc/MetJ family transcriptional regulator
MHKRRSSDATNGIHVRLESELLRAIECFRRSEQHIPTRPEAIRRLLQRALAVHSGPHAAEHLRMPTTARAKPVSKHQASST